MCVWYVVHVYYCVIWPRRYSQLRNLKVAESVDVLTLIQSSRNFPEQGYIYINLRFCAVMKVS